MCSVGAGGSLNKWPNVENTNLTVARSRGSPAVAPTRLVVFIAPATDKHMGNKQRNRGKRISSLLGSPTVHGLHSTGKRFS